MTRWVSLPLFLAALVLVGDRALGLFVLPALPYLIASAWVSGGCVIWALRRGAIGFVARATMLVLGLVLFGMSISLFL